MKYLSLIFVSIILSSCAPHVYNTYDKEFIDLIKKASPQNPEYALKAHSHCAAILKLDDNGLPSSYLGQCGGALMLYVHLSLESGDPKLINEALFEYAFDWPSFGNKDYYLKIAKMTISERCSAPSAPKSCTDLELMSKFGLKPESLP